MASTRFLPLSAPASPSVAPHGFTTSARQAVAIAERTSVVRRLRRAHPNLQVQAWIWAGRRWEVDYGVPARGGLNDDLAEVDVSAAGRILHVWTGLQVDTYSARGHFGGLFDSPWVILPFGLLFLVPFVDVRRPLRLRHLDLLVLLGVGLSYFFFNHANLDLSVPLAYPVLLYLLGRMLWVGFRGGGDGGGSRLPIAVLVVGLVLLVGARIAVNVANDRVIDVGYASVVGADRMWHKQPLYVNNEAHGDTYGPVTYLAYVPFERAFPWTGDWDSLPAAHAATIAFDLLTLLGLFLLGRRLRAGPPGRRLGLLLAWAWAAYPFTLLGIALNTNDGLVAMLLVYALLALSSPAARGSLLGLAAAAKFFPAALLPVVAAGRGERDWRRALLCAAGCVGVAAFAVLLYLPPGGPREFYDATLGFQLSRWSPYSLWGLHPGLGWLQTALEVLALGLAVLLAFVPRGRRSLTQVAALMGAVIVAIQLPATHWFYFYVAWFAPFAFLSLLAGRPAEQPAADPVEEAGLAAVSRPGLASA